ncbi:AraC-like DNA-binding protein [Comamonas sp. JUb58]|nr:AraC-like DNA-binding protein [Comamonas sp. JUb58]
MTSAVTSPLPPPARAAAGGDAASARRAWLYVDSLTPHLFVPTADRPVRAKLRELSGDTQVLPHQHAWAQLAISVTGTVHLRVPSATFVVPPRRALWIPPGVEHAVTLVETAELRTLYIYQAEGQCGPGPGDSAPNLWRRCRVLEVSELMRALVCDLSTEPDDGPAPSAEQLARERHVSALLLDELRQATQLDLRVDMPRDKRLHSLCQAVMDDPLAHDSLQAFAHNSGASPRTIARLFRQELGCTYLQWRQQVILAKAVELGASGLAIGQIAAELGYTPSAFSAMVQRACGLSPVRFLGMQTR